MKPSRAPATAVSLIPPHRSSTRSELEIRLWCREAAVCLWTKKSEGMAVESHCIDLAGGGEPTVIRSPLPDRGVYALRFDFMNDRGDLIESHQMPYEVVESGVRSTRCIDGCWVSLVHWSEEESRHFNTDLKKLTHDEWMEQIRAMDDAGIKSVLIQNMFDSAAYVGRHEMSADSYDGVAFYPSELVSKRYPLACEDVCEAILQAADERGMTVFMGVGLFAWFDYSAESLEWHKRVTRELFDRYGHHPSLYAWYISEEMFGSLYEEEEFVPREAYKDVVRFFAEYRAFVNELTPTKPVAMAPNNIRFHEFPEQWAEVLANLDILIPFAFARDPENLNIRQIQEICDRAGTHFWVDMEMFRYPFDEGLMPKPIDELVREIEVYDDVEQIFGYQFTGLMNPPESKRNLGGELAKQVYVDYVRYARSVHGGQEQAPVHDDDI